MRRGPAKTEGQTYGTGKMGSDRRSLRNDIELRIPEDLVPTPRDGVLGRRDGAVDDVPDLIGPRHLARARRVEAAGAIVQQGGVRGTQGKSHCSVALMARRTDGVEALTPPLKRPERKVKVSTRELRLEELPQEAGFHVGPVVGGSRSAAFLPRADHLDEVFVDRLSHLHLTPFIVLSLRGMGPTGHQLSARNAGPVQGSLSGHQPGRTGATALLLLSVQVRALAVPTSAAVSEMLAIRPMIWKGQLR